MQLVLTTGRIMHCKLQPGFINPLMILALRSAPTPVQLQKVDAIANYGVNH